MTAPFRRTDADSLDLLPEVAEAEAAMPADITRLIGLGEPAVLRGLVADWPATLAAKRGPTALDDYLRPFDRGAPVPVMEAPPAAASRFSYAADLREFSFTKRQRPFRETLDRIARAAAVPGGPTIAIQMLPLAELLPGFVAANAMPLLPVNAAPRLWLGGPVRTQTHNDRDHNLACVVAGRRRFLLFPPEQVANLYVGPLDRPPPLSLVDPEAPDLARFPRFVEALANARVAHLGPGDALLLPRYWWHHVTSRDPYNAMVNYWWGECPLGLEDANTGFLVALLAFRHLPPADRRYWRAMLDTYVFADGDEGVAHIPPALRGALGTMPAHERAALRRALHAAITKSS
jgi:hypothetical protein